MFNKVWPQILSFKTSDSSGETEVKPVNKTADIETMHNSSNVVQEDSKPLTAYLIA